MWGHAGKGAKRLSGKRKAESTQHGAILALRVSFSPQNTSRLNTSLLCALCFVLCALCAGPLAFAAQGDILRLDADGGPPQNLTLHSATAIAPAWSPDGTRLAFLSDRDRDPQIFDLSVMCADGSQVTRVTTTFQVQVFCAQGRFYLIRALKKRWR